MSFKPVIRFIFALSALAAIPLTLSACDSLQDGAVTSYPPPADEIEITPQIEDPMAEIWRPGYWSVADGGGFSWVSGRVIPRPDPTAVWGQARWVRHTYGWSFEQGHWE